jgi:hypothetical protein
VGTYAGNRPLWLSATGIGEAWLDTAARIVHDGIPGQWDGLPLRELPRAIVEVDVPAPDDQLIALHADSERLPWMHVNLTDRARVADLGDADSYATRLYDYNLRTHLRHRTGSDARHRKEPVISILHS